jgi:hypothetical protein
MIGRKIRIVFLPPQTATTVFGSTTLCMNPAGFQLQAGGRRAAEIYSLIESAKLNPSILSITSPNCSSAC